MTAGELITKLSRVPPDTPVLVADWNEQYAGYTDVGRVSLLNDPSQHDWIDGKLRQISAAPVVLLGAEFPIGEDL